ncbi:MAG TPA: nucleotide exchange factor GrpE [Caulobacteraceae bacterium]|jgi:molecular chaperone GrpE
MSDFDVDLEGFEEQNGEGATELETVQAELASMKDQALRLAAEAENTRRRAEREANEARAFAITRFAKDLMGVADNLGRALEHAPRDAEDPLVRNLAVGLEMTQKALGDAFDRNGLKRISPAVGERFDPHQHQAVMEQTSAEFGPGCILQVLQDGYELFGRNLRAAMVIVAARDSTGQTPDGGAQDTESAPASPGVTD